MALRVALDTLGLDVRLSCGLPDVSGVRPAMASVVGPPWVTLRLLQVGQAPEVCGAGYLRGGRASGPKSIRRWVQERAGVTIGLGVTRDARGVLMAGPGAVMGLRVWP